MKGWAFVVLGLGFAALGAVSLHGLRVGDKVGDGVVVATGQLASGAGTRITFSGRPVDIVRTPDGTVFMKTTEAVVRLERDKLGVTAKIPGASLHGLAVTPDGQRVLATDADRGLHIFRASNLEQERVISFESPKVGGSAYPCGLTVTPDGKSAYVCLSRSNLLAKVDLDKGEILSTIPVEPAPYDVALAGDTAVVSCWGRTPQPGETKATASGTPVAIDDRGIVTGGAICFVDLSTTTVKSVNVARQPSQVLIASDQLAYLPCANGDRLLAVDPKKGSVLRDTPIRLDKEPSGSAPNALALSPDGKRLYVACGGINAVAVFDLGNDREKLAGFIPADWYPIGLIANDDQLIVANAKGLGSRAKANESQKGVYDFLGSLNRVPLAGIELNKTTAQTKANARLLADQTSDAKNPMWTRPGHRSPIRHIFYVLKENRTYDQVLGDMGKGDSDPKLVIYGQNVTPNHHALADEFALLDNYYCNGVLSADGHAWAVEGNTTSYFERTFGGWTRSYPFGDDPISVSESGFFWNNLLAHGKTFRNYGEFDYATPVPGDMSFLKIYKDYQANKPFAFRPNIGVASLRPYSCPITPGWNLNIPDVVRARGFIEDFGRLDRAGKVPDVCLIYLPQDHTSGLSKSMPKPASHVADNDLALGQVVEAISKSSVWRESVIFVNEDDPQNGFDHVDGHRSLCLIAGPYVRRNVVVSEFYNQTSVLHTIDAILGIPPANRMIAGAPLMGACFQAKPNLKTYSTRPNEIPLDEMNGQPSSMSKTLRRWAAESNEMDFRHPDAVDDEDLNRTLWAAARGGDPFPADLTGAHGKGLAKRGLTLSKSGVRKDED